MSIIAYNTFRNAYKSIEINTNWSVRFEDVPNTNSNIPLASELNIGVQDGVGFFLADEISDFQEFTIEQNSNDFFLFKYPTYKVIEQPDKISLKYFEREDHYYRKLVYDWIDAIQIEANVSMRPINASKMIVLEQLNINGDRSITHRCQSILAIEDISTEFESGDSSPLSNTLTFNIIGYERITT